MKPVRTPLEETLIEVFREQRSRLWGFFARGPASSGTAEDLLQETFLRAWDHRDALGSSHDPEGREAVRRYLWRVARNLMIDEIRHRYRRGGTDADPARKDGSDDRPVDRVEIDESLRVVRETVATLPNARGRRCLQLWIEENDMEAIAREMKLGVNQVRGLLQRARADVIDRAANRFRIRPAGPPGGKGGLR